MTQINWYKAAKESFPVNILVALVIGIVVGYFVGSYVTGGVGGKAIGDVGCGNNIREGTELCDGGIKACMVDGYKGTQTCNSICDFDACVAAESCGDLTRNNDEQCDGADLGGLNCQALGFNSGTLSCSACSFDTSSCTN